MAVLKFFLAAAVVSGGVLAQRGSAATAPASFDAGGDSSPASCAGCNEESAQHYQKCAMEYGDACSERVGHAEIDGLGQELVTGGQGTKKDVTCCRHKMKHETCMECMQADGSYGTKNGAQKNDYYMKRMKAYEKANGDKNWDMRAMEKAGWGDQSNQDRDLDDDTKALKAAAASGYEQGKTVYKGTGERVAAGGAQADRINTSMNDAYHAGDASVQGAGFVEAQYAGPYNQQ